MFPCLRRMGRVCLIVLVLSVMLPRPAYADGTTITVTTVEDLDGSRCAAGYPCSLRMALSNASTISGAVTIAFDIPGPAPHVILLDEPLQTILKNDLAIRGESDPDFIDRPVIVLDGSRLTESSALHIAGDRLTVRGLSLVGFSRRTPVIGIQGDHNTVRNNLIGLSPAGEARGGGTGITVWGDGNTVRDNVISGNLTGIAVHGEDNRLYGNYIGLDLSGTRLIPGMATGIHLDVGANYTVIGGSGRGEGNVIAGAAPWGWGISVGSAFGNVIIGNRIGTNAAGDAALPNYIGIEIGSITCTGGCTVPFNTRIEGNLISGNLSCGLDLGRFTTLVYANYIGTDASGTRPLPNGECGVRLSGEDVRLGGTSPGQGNVISGNPIGVRVEGSGHQIAGNSIGTGADGLTAVPNGIGVLVEDSGNLIGGDEAGHGNLISGNETGIVLAADHVVVRNNRIGTDGSGLGALPNGVGIRLDGYGEGSYLGGGEEAMGNIVAFNRSHGVELSLAGGARVTGNLIHDNGGDGIRLGGGAGASGSAARNTFSLNRTYDNAGLGIAFENPGLNRGISRPEISATERTYAAGRACPNCRIEVFLSDSDPSGFGEGQTFVAWNLAGADRAFRVTFPDVGVCKVLTATATDPDGNTSTFSANADAGLCFRPAPLLAVLWVIVAAGGGSAFTLIIRRRPLSLRLLPWLVGGGLLGAAIGILLLSLPFVQLNWGQPGGQPPPAPPAEFPAPVTLTPAQGQRPPGQITLTPASAPEAMARQDANCRQGPSTAFSIATHLLQGQVVPLTGRLEQGGWWQVQSPDLQLPCWVSEEIVELNGDLSSVPFVVGPQQPTITPVLGCWQRPNPQAPAQCVVPCPAGVEQPSWCTP